MVEERHECSYTGDFPPGAEITLIRARRPDDFDGQRPWCTVVAEFAVPGGMVGYTPIDCLAWCDQPADLDAVIAHHERTLTRIGAA